MWDLSRMLGQWACVRKPSVLSIGEMQRECTALITKGLREFLSFSSQTVGTD